MTRDDGSAGAVVVEGTGASPRPGRHVPSPIPALLAGMAVVTFYLVTVPPDPPMRWQPVQAPGPFNPSSLEATPDRFVALSPPTADGVLLWWSVDGIAWSSEPLPGSPSHVTPQGDGVVAFEDYAGVRLRSRVDGWAEVQRIAFPDLVRAGYGSGRSGIVATETAMLAQTVSGDLLWSAGGDDFEQVIAAPRWGPPTGMAVDDGCLPTTEGSIDVAPMVWSGEGFVALVSAEARDPVGVWPVCSPEVWESPDGIVWKRATVGSPFGAGAFVYDLAWRAGTFVAVGGHGFADPAMWVSTDGREWQEVPDPSWSHPYELREVEAGELGWIVLGALADRPGLVGWVSPDGRCWAPLPAHVQGTIAAATSDRILVIDRRPPAQSWLGVASSGTLRC